MPQNSRFPDIFVKGHHDWSGGLSNAESSLYHQLAQDGQSPKAMVIACCDSRILVPEMFGSGPGEIFVLRNIANLVPPLGQDNGMSAALEFGINAFKVEHVAVMGHARCGGVASSAAHFESGQSAEGTPTLEWLEILRPAYEKVCSSGHDHSHAEGKDGSISKELEQQAVRMSLENLQTYSVVTDAIKEERLSLHGLWFDIETACLHQLDTESDSFTRL